ncbi:MAG: DUF1549 domain-containing protein, partial [Acidobacteria bacterium]|nr:DUF1549 domain-containing protein [Acidobacteriota bacterium]
MLHSHSTATAPAPGFRGRSISARGAALAAVVAALLAALFPLAAAPGPRFEQDVVPILGRYCFHCHGEAVKMGDLDLRTPASMLKGGSKGPALAPGSPERSIFYQRIADKSMPMGPAKLSDAEQRVIHEWISGGAAAASPHPAGESGSGARIHWAFRPPERPPVPPVRSAGQVRTAVDRFLLSRLESRGIQPAPPADGATLLRRAYLNLIGLPPSLEEQETFLADRSPDAYEKVVEALLARPQYGERWARRWLDVVRYAESNGYERDGVKPHAWRYRDYVIDAFNRDKPFDRFLTEQLAGDLLPDATLEQRVASGFNRNHVMTDEGGAIPEEYLVEYAVDRASTTASVF